MGGVVNESVGVGGGVGVGGVVNYFPIMVLFAQLSSTLLSLDTILLPHSPLPVVVMCVDQNTASRARHNTQSCKWLGWEGRGGKGVMGGGERRGGEGVMGGEGRGGEGVMGGGRGLYIYDVCMYGGVG